MMLDPRPAPLDPAPDEGMQARYHGDCRWCSDPDASACGCWWLLSKAKERMRGGDELLMDDINYVVVVPDEQAGGCDAYEEE